MRGRKNDIKPLGEGKTKGVKESREKWKEHEPFHTFARVKPK